MNHYLFVVTDEHYQKIIVALVEAERLMREVDGLEFMGGSL